MSANQVDEKTRSDPAPESMTSLSRRSLFKSLAAIPVVAVGLQGCSEEPAARPARIGQDQYAPTFFNSTQWALLNAACGRLIPSDDVGPGALDLGVPEFIDRHMHTPYASGANWYMQGPFIEAPATLGYQGQLPLREILRVGMNALDFHCTKSFDGKTFAQLDDSAQDGLLKSAESGQLALEGISSQLFFTQLLAETRNGYFSDPMYGGNKNMGSWKMIGYPGMRADYLEWVTVRDRPYPLPPVVLAGRRG